MSAGFRLRVGLIGDPVAHSISPAMHQPAFDALGIPATYERWPTAASELPARIGSLRLPDALGANVTVPHKIAAMDYVDEISPVARKAGAVNTIVNRDGNLFGDNTDVYGFLTSVKAACPDTADRNALILGAGGAARGVVLALDQIRIGSITVANRDRARASSLAHDLAPILIQPICSDLESLASVLPDTDILINATVLGWLPGELPIEPHLLETLPASALVVDLTYRDTELLAAARARGLATLDGLPMLVHQGVRAFELFTGQNAPVETMMEAALRAREVRT